jgi:hypothetical protein
MGGNKEEENKIKVVKVLARAASDRDFYKRLVTDTTRTLNDEGIQGKEFYIPDEKALKSILCIVDCLGDIIDKRS